MSFETLPLPILEAMFYGMFIIFPIIICVVAYLIERKRLQMLAEASIINDEE